MHLSSVVLAAFTLGAAAHSEMLSVKELQRRGDLSKRCAGAVGNMNRKRHLARQAKRAEGNSTYEITTEAPFYENLQNDTCVLSPLVTQGPYVWPRSQTLRQDMSESQPGVPITLDFGVMDMATCEPLPNILLSLWHCNGTGSYSSFTGLSPNTPFLDLLNAKNITDTFEIGKTDLHTDETTFLRGLWPTNDHGIMEMKTIYPGFYVGRAIHIHVQAYTDWALHDNGTVSSGNIVSTGQFYFDEALNQQIIALEPYVSHTQINRTLQSQDDVYMKGFRNGYNPVFQVIPADGENPENGMIGYITIGIDTNSAGVIDENGPDGPGAAN